MISYNEWIMIKLFESGYEPLLALTTAFSKDALKG